MIVYCLDPLDYWSGWQKPEDVFTGKNEDEYGGESHEQTEWSPLWEKAQELARILGWEGDIRGGYGNADGGPHVSVLPDEGGAASPVVIAWKQDNNGTTFVASPYRLPWLEAAASSSIAG